MTLYFIGLGPSIEYLSLKAIRVLKNADKIIVDTYTSLVPGFSIDYLRKVVGEKPVIVMARRSDLEGKAIDSIIEEALDKDIALLVPGDPFIATTHDAIRVEAYKRGVHIETVYGVSVYGIAASASGLQAYRFGKTVTLVYPIGFKPYSVIDTIYDNLSRNLHTLLLLDLKLDKGVAMTIPEAVHILLDLEREYAIEPFLDKVLGIGLARLGTSEEFVKADRLSNLDRYGYPKPPHSIIVVAKPHPIELDLMYYIGSLPRKLYIEYSRRKTYP